MQNIIFAFDLDGTVTSKEILPELAHELGLYKEMDALTRITLKGEIDYEASFKLRFQILKSIPYKRVREIVSEVPLNPEISAFIRSNKEICRIVTANLDNWVLPLVERLGCQAFTSQSHIDANGQLVLESVLNKGYAVKQLRRTAQKVIATGESVNDIAMFEEADIGIAFGGVHEPVAALKNIADHVIYDSRELCRLLNMHLTGIDER